MKPLDFLIIGAQKCATTSLFEQLRDHPQLNLPLEKEVPFFTADDCDADSWSRFADTHFGAPDGRLWGKATPQYLCEPGCAERIRALAPDVKLVAILRDPVERCLSHYKMGLRRGTEERSFDSAIGDLLRDDALALARTAPAPSHSKGYEPESDFYVTWSEYGRALTAFRARFPAEQLLVLYTEDLERDPEGTLDLLLDFLGLETGFRPAALGQVIHRGGTGNWISQDIRTRLRHLGLVSWLWDRVPPTQQGRLRFLYERINTRHRPGDEPTISEQTRRHLRSHFAKDVRQLQKLGIPAPPWADAYCKP